MAVAGHLVAMCRYAILKEAGAPRYRLKKTMQQSAKELKHEVMAAVAAAHETKEDASVPQSAAGGYSAAKHATVSTPVSAVASVGGDGFGAGVESDAAGAGAGGEEARNTVTWADGIPDAAVSRRKGIVRRGTPARPGAKSRRAGLARPEADAPITAWARDTSWIPRFLKANASKSQNSGDDRAARSGEDMVRVAVRVRPLMPAEIEIGEEQVVRVSGRDVELDLGAKAAKMRFTFDNTFDSSSVDSPATQQDVFEVSHMGVVGRGSCSAVLT